MLPVPAIMLRIIFSVLALSLFPSSARAELLAVDNGSRIFFVWAPDWRAKNAASRLFEIIQAESSALPLKAGELVHASSCSLLNPLSDKLFSGPVPRDPNHSNPPLALLSKKATKLPDVLAVINTTDVGARALALFMPGFGYTFKIEMMNKEVLQRVRHNRHLVAAVYDPMTKTLHFNKEEEIGKVAYVLLHEMVHSLDKEAATAVDQIERLQKLFDDKLMAMNTRVAERTSKLREELQRSDYLPEELTELIELKKKADQAIEIRTYRTERLAHDASFQVWKQLAERYPEYYRNGPAPLLGGKPAREIAQSDKTPFYYTDDYLIAISALTPDIIKRYKEGKCKSLNSVK